MFKTISLISFLCFLSFNSLSKPLQTPDQKRITALEKRLQQQTKELLEQQEEDLTELRKTIEEQQKRIEEQQEAIEKSLNPNYEYFYNSDKDTRYNGWAWTSFVIPLCILTVLFGLVYYIKESRYSLKDALSETKLIGANQVTIESSSRLIAFISACSAISISLTLFTIGLYIYLDTGIIPDFGILVNVILALGIGVVPYSINKVAGALK